MGVPVLMTSWQVSRIVKENGPLAAHSTMMPAGQQEIRE